jgi:hypothetical protein
VDGQALRKALVSVLRCAEHAFDIYEVCDTAEGSRAETRVSAHSELCAPRGVIVVSVRRLSHQARRHRILSRIADLLDVQQQVQHEQEH